MKASLRHVLLAVEVGEASLVGESAGYIVLGAADRALVRASVAHSGSVFLDPDGQVHLDGTLADAEAVEGSLRQLLGELLGRVRTPCPNLERVAQRRQCRGLATLVTELEAALVPVNRRAARRSLGRLCRDAERSRHLEWTRARVEPVVEQAPAEPFAAPLGSFDAPSGLPPSGYEDSSIDVVFDVPVEHAAVVPQYADEDAAVTTLRESAGVEQFTQMHAPVHHQPAEWFTPAPVEEEPTRVRAVEVQVAAPSVAERASAPLLAGDAFVADAPLGAAVADVAVVSDASLSDAPMSSVATSDAALDGEPTPLLVAEVHESSALPTPARPPLRKVKALGAWRSSGPELPEGAPLVEVPEGAERRRPSDVSELLARFTHSEPVHVELLEGLRQLTHVEHTPVPPVLGEAGDLERSTAPHEAQILAS